MARNHAKRPHGLRDVKPRIGCGAPRTSSFNAQICVSISPCASCRCTVRSRSARTICLTCTSQRTGDERARGASHGAAGLHKWLAAAGGAPGGGGGDGAGAGSNHTASTRHVPPREANRPHLALQQLLPLKCRRAGVSVLLRRKHGLVELRAQAARFLSQPPGVGLCGGRPLLPRVKLRPPRVPFALQPAAGVSLQLELPRELSHQDL